jgi:hypothetical protein
MRAMLGLPSISPDNPRPKIESMAATPSMIKYTDEEMTI